MAKTNTHEAAILRIPGETVDAQWHPVSELCAMKTLGTPLVVLRRRAGQISILVTAYKSHRVDRQLGFQ